MGPADLLPKSVLSSPASARRRVAAIAAAASAACALAGCWFRFGDGLAIRTSLGLTSAVFGALTLHVALGAKSAWGAALRALGVSTVLGTASIVLPSAFVAGDEHVPFMACVVFGAFFGAFTGFVYGLALAALAGLTWRDVRAFTHEGADHAARTAAVWSLFPIAIATMTTLLYDAQEHVPEWASERTRAAHAVAVPLGVAGFLVALAVVCAAFVVAELRLVRRRRWIAEVIGDDPRWSVRAASPHDDLASLPRLRDGGHVLEYQGEESAYRVAANARPVAIL